MSSNAKPNGEYCLNWLDSQLPSAGAKRLYAQDTAMLVATEGVLGAMEANGVSRTEIATRIGKTKGFVSQVLNGSRNMTLRTLADLYWALGLEVREIVARPIGESRVKYAKFDEYLDSACEVSCVQGSSEKEFAVEGELGLVAA